MLLCVRCGGKGWRDLGVCVRCRRAGDVFYTIKADYEAAPSEAPKGGEAGDADTAVEGSDEQA